MSKKLASVKITGTENVRKSLLKYVNDTLRDDSFLHKVGAESVDLLRKSIQAGQEEYKQKPLSPLTVEVRKLLEENNSTAPFYGARKSNLTFSGQLLGSIKYAINKASSEVKLFLDDYRYKLLPINKEQADLKLKTAKKGYAREKNKEAGNTGQQVTKIIAAHIAQKPQELKTNKKIKEDLESQGRKFFFISDKLNTLLQNRIAAEIRRRLTQYQKLRRKLSL